MSPSTDWESIISSVRFLGFFTIPAIILLSCAPKPPKQAPEIPQVRPLPAPYDLKAETDSHKATLYWSIDRSQGQAITGYNIYLSENVIDSAAWAENPGAPFNSTPYPGDTDGDISRESIPLDNLTNGKTYCVIINTVGPDGRESKPSNLAVFMPLAHGAFTISDNHEVSNGGFNFENEMAVPGRDPRSDIYLYSTEDKIGLSSPNRLGAGFRRSRFAQAGGLSDGDETIQISKGDKIDVKTRFGRAEITIDDIAGKYPSMTARVRYVFYPDKP